MVVCNNYGLCTVKELAEILAHNIKENNWIDYDFVMPDETVVDISDSNNAFSKAVNTSEGWFGVKKIKTGFDNDDHDIFFDYYGCGCGQYLNIYDSSDFKNNVDAIQQKIIDVIAEHGDGELKLWDLLFTEKLINKEKKGE